MCYAELGHIPRPQRLEMVGQANLPSSIHFRRLPVQFRKRNLRRGGWVSDRDLEGYRCGQNGNEEMEWPKGPYIECHVELVFEEIVHVPALAEPLGALLVGLETEPVHVRGLVALDILEFKENRELECVY